MYIAKRYQLEKAVSNIRKDSMGNIQIRRFRDKIQAIATNGKIIAVVPVELKENETEGQISPESFTFIRKNPAYKKLTIIDYPIIPDQDPKPFLPDYEVVFPKKPVAFSISLDIDLLSALSDAIGTNLVTLSFYGDGSAILVEPYDKTNPAIGLVMPIAEPKD